MRHGQSCRTSMSSRALVAEGAFVTACEHTFAHEYRDACWPWIFSFLLDHPADIVDEPSADVLPTSFPAWCDIVE